MAFPFRMTSKLLFQKWKMVFVFFWCLTSASEMEQDITSFKGYRIAGQPFLRVRALGTLRGLRRGDLGNWVCSRGRLNSKMVN